MISFEQIQQKIKLINPCFTVIEKSLMEALGHVLQQNVTADMNMPPFDKSAMDGYACRHEDLQNTLEVVEIIPAGRLPSKTIESNQCSKIMTGASIPKGADCVFMIEDTERNNENHVRCTNQHSKTNICNRGEDYKKGDVLLKKGQILRPEHISVMAGAGLHKVKVSQMPRIGLIVTGSELVEYSKIPTDGKIRNTNAIQILALAKKMFLDITYYGIVKDDMDNLLTVFTKALTENDIIIFTGGASVGDFDLIPEILRLKGFQILWDRTGLKPGNPMNFSMKDNQFCFGLSGNPVSSLVQFEYLVKPVLYQLMEGNYLPVGIKSRLMEAYSRKKANRFGIVPVYINFDGMVELLPFNGSAHINALTKANALMEIPEGVKELEKGEMTYVRPL